MSFSKKTTTTASAADTAPRRGPGRPKKGERRALLIERFGEGRVKQLDGEAGKPCETLAAGELEELYNHVAKEKGWGTVFRPAF